MKHQVSILAIPQRVEQFADPLMRRLTEEGGSDVAMCVDDGRGYWENLKLCWIPVSPDITHITVLEEDVVLSTDFVATVDLMWQEWADKPAILTLHASGKRQMELAKKGKHWMKVSDIGNQAISMPVHLGQFWCDWFESVRDTAPKTCFGTVDVMDKPMVHGDRVIAYFAKSFNIPIMASIPSIVQHVGQEYSVLGHQWSNWRERGINTSRVFAGDSVSGLDFAWVTP